MPPATALSRLEERRKPVVQWIERLNVVVSIEQRGGFAGSVKPVRVDERVAHGFDQADVFHAHTLEFGRQRLGGAANIGFVGRVGLDGRDTEESLQFFTKAGLILTGILDCG
jgi:hypothetical protein